MQILNTSDEIKFRPFLKNFTLPKADSHKGQNGKVLIVGGSQLFHSASLWSAEVASHFVDMVHYCSTEENNEIFLSLKKKFRNGIVVPRQEIDSYAAEDDIILVGPGLERTSETKAIVDDLLKKHTDKLFVLDAGAIQMMDRELLKKLKQPAIITPHQKEFESMFSLSISQLSLDEKVAAVEQKSKEFNCVILLKTVDDIVSDGATTLVIRGGNQGLTKGGTGDILAGLVGSFYSHSNAISSAVMASFILKQSAEVLSKDKGFWYNNNDILDTIPKVVNKVFL